MVQLLECQDRQWLQLRCQEAGLPFDGQTGAFVASEEENRLGWCIFHLQGERAVIQWIHALPGQGPGLVDGLVRASLSFCYGRGGRRADFAPSVDRESRSAMEIMNCPQFQDLDIYNFLYLCKNCQKSDK